MTTTGPADEGAAMARHLGRLARALPFVGIFLVTFLINLGYSFRQGRLASEPTFDDVGYLADALDRMIFHPGDGLLGAIASFGVDAPHAPVSTLTAMLGFWAFGPYPVAVYIANGWVLGLYIAVLAWISRPLGSLAMRSLFVALLAYVPVAHAMVTEFRPDMAGGLVFALALALMCTTDFRADGVRRKLLLVLVAAFATLIKPTGIVLVIPALGVAFVFTMLSQGLVTGKEKAALLRGATWPIALYVMALLPFAIVIGPSTLSYIGTVLFDDADVWTTPGGVLFHLGYHAIGAGAAEALGPFGPPALALVAVDLLLHARFASWRRKGLLPFYLTLAVVYCAMSISREKTTFQGSYFYLPLLLAAAYTLVRLVREARRLWPLVAPAVASGLLGLALAAAMLLLPLGGAYFPRAIDGAEANSLLPAVADAIFALDKNEWRDSDSCRNHQMKITVTNYDPLTAEAIQMALARGGVRVRPEYVFFARTLDEALRAVDAVDLVVMVDPAATQTNKWLLVSPMVPDIFRYLSEKPGVRRMEVGTYRNHPYWLFVKPNCTPVAPP